ncbi:hypothetical protein [Magnetospirillum sp. 64-120]|uniref:hypothetical protein n=1 Tax=Magnetospirillum sp. 64-120 TaxID=1895778 RepID=UPI00092A344F|nr:hypothetical protein [Magnetospirillum sp. 64-120]OJX77440.1 MAG: hypothetical protein BGO92_10445 [Magnetospirillum sp. 64-120]
MLDPQQLIVRGCANVDTGHGIGEWQVSCEHLAYGRDGTSTTSPLTGRPDLAVVALAGLKRIAERKLARGSFATMLQDLTAFWRFLDEMEDVSEAGGGAFRSPQTVLDIPGTIWTLFKDWMSAQGDGRAHYRYFHCKRVFDEAAEIMAPGVSTQSGYPLPPNPFPNPQKVKARVGAEQDETIEPEVMHRAAKVLFKHIEETDRRLKDAWRSVDAPADERARVLKRLAESAENLDWNLEGWECSPALRGGMTFPCLPASRVRVHVNHAWWLVPAQTDLLPVFCLFLLRTGWNTSTAMDMQAEHWSRPHPTRPQQVVELQSAKARARGAVQKTYSLKHKPEHPYQLICRVLEWTRPLRDALQRQIDSLQIESQGKGLVDIKAIEAEMSALRGLKNRVWLFLTKDGRISCLGKDTRYAYVNDLFREDGIVHQGRQLEFNQALTRNSWGIFAYESSGYNLLVTQLALGHKDLSSILHYINQKAIRNRHRRQFFDFQTHVFNEVGIGRLNPHILRQLVQNGRLTSTEAETLGKGGFRTRQGVTCVNPYAPDKGIAPSHEEGKLCQSQACLMGCSKAFVTYDCLEYVAERILHLRHYRDLMPLQAWVTSDYPHDLEFLEQIMDMFAETNRRAAFERAQRKAAPPIYTLPSAATLNRAGA